MAKKVYKRRTPYNFTLDEVLAILDEVLEIYPSTDVMYYPTLLMKRKLYPTKLQHWKTRYQEVADLIAELDEVRNAKVSEALMSRNGNAGGLVWYTKCNMGYVEEAVKIRIDADKDIAHTNLDIEIGFSD